MVSKTAESKQYVHALKAKNYDNCLKYTCTETQNLLKSYKKVNPTIRKMFLEHYGDAFHGICNLYGPTKKREAMFRLRKAYMDMRRGEECPAEIIEELFSEVRNHEIVSFRKPDSQVEKDLTLEQLMQPSHLQHIRVHGEYSPHGRRKGANGQTMGWSPGFRHGDRESSGHPQ